MLQNLNAFDQALLSRVGRDLTPEFIKKMHDQAEANSDFLVDINTARQIFEKFDLGPFCYVQSCNFRCDIWQQTPYNTAWHNITLSDWGGHLPPKDINAACVPEDNWTCGMMFFLSLIDRASWICICQFGCDDHDPQAAKKMIQRSDILSALAPSWTGLYRPLPNSIAIPQQAAPVSSVATSTTEIAKVKQDQPTQSIGTAPVQIPWLMIIIILGIILLLRR